MVGIHVPEYPRALELPHFSSRSFAFAWVGLASCVRHVDCLPHLPTQPFLGLVSVFPTSRVLTVCRPLHGFQVRSAVIAILAFIDLYTPRTCAIRSAPPTTVLLSVPCAGFEPTSTGIFIPSEPPILKHGPDWQCWRSFALLSSPLSLIHI